MPTQTTPASAPSTDLAQTQRVPAGLLAAYPTLRQAARMVGVHASTLSRQKLPVEHVGREDRLAPRVVLKLAAHYRRCDEYEVGGALVDYALAHAPDRVEEVEDEIERYFHETNSSDAPLDTARFLEAARRHLPPTLYAEVERVCRTDQR